MFLKRAIKCVFNVVNVNLKLFNLFLLNLKFGAGTTFTNWGEYLMF